jgi:hypothetical protein
MIRLTPDEVQSVLDRDEPCPPGIVEQYFNDPDCGPPLNVYLALEDGTIGQELSEHDRFYNRYLWFCWFAKLHEAKFGFDAGIQQQIDDILGKTHLDVDWAVVEELFNSVNSSDSW